MYFIVLLFCVYCILNTQGSDFHILDYTAPELPLHFEGPLEKPEMPNTTFISMTPGSDNQKHLSWILDQELVTLRTRTVANLSVGR